MNRVATIPLQRTMADAIQRSQEKLAVTQQRLSTGKKANSFSDLGTEAVRNLSAHSMLAKQDAQSTVAKRVGTTLQLYDANLGSIQSSASDLRDQLLAAIGTGQATGINEAVDAAFHQFATALNATEGGVPLFGGSQTGSDPFAASDLSQLPSMNASDVFKNDEIKTSARVGDNVDVQYGITASDVGTDLFSAFKQLAQMGTISETPTDAEKAQLAAAVDSLNKGLGTVNTVNAANGRNQSEVDTLATRGDERSLVLKDVISGNEDADLGQVALDLTQQKQVLQASYSVFSQLSNLSLLDYLK
jgi:flagellar hook-associated protein 3 FlgL